MPKVAVSGYTKVRLLTVIRRLLNRLSGSTALLVSRVWGSLTVYVRLRWSLLLMLPLSGDFHTPPDAFHGVRPFSILSVDDPAILPSFRAKLLRLTVRALTVYLSGLASIFTSSVGCGIQVVASGSTE